MPFPSSLGIPWVLLNFVSPASGPKLKSEPCIEFAEKMSSLGCFGNKSRNPHFKTSSRVWGGRGEGRLDTA